MISKEEPKKKITKQKEERVVFFHVPEVHIVQKGVVQQLIQMIQSPHAPVRELTFALGA
ncbi:unnamed protein product [Camellia sinensis]